MRDRQNNARLKDLLSSGSLIVQKDIKLHSSASSLCIVLITKDAVRPSYPPTVSVFREGCRAASFIRSLLGDIKRSTREVEIVQR